MQSTDRVAASGMVVADRYRLIEPLGAGGMGAVWRAEHLNLRSPVAVKLLNPAIADDPEMLDRFLREAQAAAALRGNYVVQVFDYGVHGGLPFIAMELLSGVNLGRRLALVHVLSTVELSWVFAHVSRAVSRAHELGIVHRDLKPDNIFIVRDGDEEVAKVLDFGIAKVLPSSIPLEEDSSQTTRTGTVLGTPFYMSPEQARGNKTVDYRADLWSMGVIAFECLTGRLPFTSSALGDLVVKICTHATPVPSEYAEVPEGFDQWFSRACEKAPEDRFQSMREQNEALQGILGHIAQPLSPNRSTPRGRRVDAQVGFAAQLARDFGDFQTLESLNPPAPDATPAVSLSEIAAEANSHDGPPSSTHSTPAGFVVAGRPRSSRLVPALVVAALIGGGVFGLRSVLPPRGVNSKPAALEESAPFSVAVPVKPQPAPARPQQPEPPVPVASATTALFPTPNAQSSGKPSSNPATSETAPMDMASSSAKLAKRKSGSGLTVQEKVKTKATSTLEVATPTSTTTFAASVTVPEVVTTKQVLDESRPSRGLFDDRE